METTIDLIGAAYFGLSDYNDATFDLFVFAAQADDTILRLRAYMN